MKILLICACISLDTNSVIPVILSAYGRQCKGGNTDLFRKKRTGIYDFPGADQYLHCR